MNLFYLPKALVKERVFVLMLGIKGQGGGGMELLDKIVVLENEASAFGFQWETTAQIMTQILSECGEIDEHLGLEEAPTVALQEEIGDLLHAVFSLCVFCNLSPKETLEKTLNKFERRLHAVKTIAQEEQGVSTLHGFSFEELMAIWQKAKSRVG